MGKVKKSKDIHSYRHNPLDQQILESNYAQASTRNKSRSKQLKDDKFVDNKLANEILKQARQQQEDIEEETGFSHCNSAPFSGLSSSDESASEDCTSLSSTDSTTESEEFNISEDAKEALQKFFSEDSEQRSISAEMIKGTLSEKRTEVATLYSDVGSVFDAPSVKLPVAMFQKLVPILKDYQSGKLPKVFKAIPKFSNWEQMLNLTEPDKWSAATMYQATRMFSSNLQDKMAQRFYNLYLLPRLRDDIHESKCLNDHLYNALKKALYKPAAFFKGIIIPLCKDKECTLREAAIFGSVLSKCSIPVLHSSAALLTIAELEYSDVKSIFMRILLEKKYALPYRVINGVVDHFMRFMGDKKEYPLKWHQCLLTFVQTYKIDLSPEQKANLLKLIADHYHKEVTPEIRKELEAKTDLNDVMQQMFKI